VDTRDKPGHDAALMWLFPVHEPSAPGKIAARIAPLA